MIMISIAAAASAGSCAHLRVVNTMVVSNTVKSGVGDGTKLYAGYTRTGKLKPSARLEAGASGSEVAVEADDDSVVVQIAGALGVSAGSAGVGASVVVLVFNKTVTADAGRAAVIMTRSNVSVTAYTTDSLWLLGLALGASGSAGVAARQRHGLQAHQGFPRRRRHRGRQGGRSGGSDPSHQHRGSNRSRGSAGVTGIAIVTYFYNSTIAEVTDNAKITARR
jgi:hypothetical protein